MSSPVAGIEKLSEGSITRSGVPSFQPSGNVAAGGAVAGSPCGVPPSAHAVSVAISAGASERSCLNFGPTPGVGFHGGIRRSSTTPAMSSARLRACSKVSSAKGPTCPLRWHSWQFLWRIGATSLK